MQFEHIREALITFLPGFLAVNDRITRFGIAAFTVALYGVLYLDVVLFFV